MLMLMDGTTSDWRGWGVKGAGETVVESIGKSEEKTTSKNPHTNTQSGFILTYNTR